MTSASQDIARAAHAWPFEEARKVLARVEKRGTGGKTLFETGYGPSGLPHIGTFGEVARTTMVRHAFRVLTDDKIKTRLIASPTTWTACARCRTTCRTRRCWRSISASR
jgi:lysyl-tRNA synthetase class I